MQPEQRGAHLGDSFLLMAAGYTHMAWKLTEEQEGSWETEPCRSEEEAWGLRAGDALT